MPASWKKIVLEGLDADLNQITASSGIQITSSLTLTTASNADFKVLVADPSTGDVKGEDQANVGAQGSNLSSFVTMSIGGTATVSASSTNNTLNIITSSGNPLTLSGVASSDTIQFTVATHSREDVEDLADDLLTGPHQDITINYDDDGVNPGTFSLIGNLPLVFGDAPGEPQVNVNFSQSINIATSTTQSFARADHFNNGDNVKFANITVNPADFYYNGDTNGLSIQPYNPIGPTGPNPSHHGGAGNISQLSDLQVHGYHGGYLSPYSIAAGDSSYKIYNYPWDVPPEVWVSSSLVHIVNDSHISGNLTIPDNQSFIFQGYGFTDSHVLSHNGSNIFGSGDMPSALTASQQFTGSIIVTGSSITLQQSNSFYGNGSGITGISSSAIEGVNGDALLYAQSFGSYINTPISGAFQFLSPTLRTASATDGTVSAITASGTTVTSTTGLASGKQIYTFLSASDADFLDTIAANYVVSASTTDISGSDITTTGNIGTVGGVVTQTIALNISKSTDGSDSVLTGDRIMFVDNNVTGDPTVKTTITNLSSLIVGSSLGTVTGISAGNGISVTNGTGYDGETVVNTTIDILLSGSEGSPGLNSTTITVNDVGGHTTSNLVIEGDNDLGLNPLLNLTSIDVGTGSFTHLKITDSASLANLETNVVSISDNFMYLNGDLGEVDPLTPNPHDAGISVNRGDSNDANLFWDENVRRWSLSKEDLQTNELTGSLPNSYLILTTNSTNAPTNPESGFQTPLYGIDDEGNALSDSSTVGQIHVHTDATSPEVWIYA